MNAIVIIGSVVMIASGSGLILCGVMLIRNNWVYRTRIKWLDARDARYDSAVSYDKMMSMRNLSNWESDIGAWIK